MEIEYRKDFKKQFKKLSLNIKSKFADKIVIFLENQSHPLLNTHKLKGKRLGEWSINITGDYRAIYVQRKDRVIFLEIGNHSELYE
jgi:addiction module RelE/StbE family toxin